MFVGYSDQNMLIKSVSTELAKMSLWLAANKLSLNIKETNFVLFCSRNMKISFTPDIKFNKITITQLTNTNFSGVHINDVMAT
jgi:hypothetical protein